MRQNTAITTHSTCHQGSWNEEAHLAASRVWQQVVNTVSGIDFSLAHSHELCRLHTPCGVWPAHAPWTATSNIPLLEKVYETRDISEFADWLQNEVAPLKNVILTGRWRIVFKILLVKLLEDWAFRKRRWRWRMLWRWGLDQQVLRNSVWCKWLRIMSKDEIWCWRFHTSDVTTRELTDQTFLWLIHDLFGFLVEWLLSWLYPKSPYVFPKWPLYISVRALLVFSLWLHI
jgi:hypothetical protein